MTATYPIKVAVRAARAFLKALTGLLSLLWRRGIPKIF